MKKKTFLPLAIILIMTTATAQNKSGKPEIESDKTNIEIVEDESLFFTEDKYIESEFKDDETENNDSELFFDDIDYTSIENEKNNIPKTDYNNTESIEPDELDTEFSKTNASYFPFLNSDLISRPEVEKHRNDYLSPKRTELLYKILENAMEYRLYVRKAINDRDLPGELEYLPVVESGYRTTAKSRSGALGLWQFMENSVKPFLTLTDYVDERLDPWKSTEAGLSKLEDNFKIFGDWLLAIGAYNCGAGAMSKAIKKADSRDFWYLAENGFLPSQTREYVPKLIAIADLAVNSEKYGIELPSHDEEYELLVNERDAIFDYIEVDKAYSISAIAMEMRIDEATLKRLNPSLTKGFTPPSAKFQIRVPSGMFDSAKNAIASIKPIDFPFKYKVVAGDSLWTISRRFGVTVKMLCDTNGIEENAILKIGKILYIPSK